MATNYMQMGTTVAPKPAPASMGPMFQQPGNSVTDPNSPYYGMPSAPGFQQEYNQSQALLPQYQSWLNENSQGFDQFRDQALRKGASPWATLAKQQQDALSADAMDKGAQQVAGQTAGAEANLASQGGLSSGARERAAEGGAKNYMSMAQDNSRGKALNDLQIGVNDEQNRISQLGQLPGMEGARVAGLEGVSQKDQANTIAEAKAQNEYNQNLYSQQMSAWAANQQADAIGRSGKK